MACSHIISGLTAKRDEIRRAIADYEAKAKAARADLITISAALKIFGEDTGEPKAYRESNRLFRRGELARIVFDALRDVPGGLETKELAAVVMQSKGVNKADAASAKTIINRVGAAMQRYLTKGQVRHSEIRSGVRIWLLRA